MNLPVILSMIALPLGGIYNEEVFEVSPLLSATAAPKPQAKITSLEPRSFCVLSMGANGTIVTDRSSRWSVHFAKGFAKKESKVRASSYFIIAEPISNKDFHLNQLDFRLTVVTELSPLNAWLENKRKRIFFRT